MEFLQPVTGVFIKEDMINRFGTTSNWVLLDLQFLGKRSKYMRKAASEGPEHSLLCVTIGIPDFIL